MSHPRFCPEAWREDIDAFLAKCEELLAKAEATRADLLERGAWPEELEDLDRYIAHTRRQIDQTDRRILQGEVIPQKEKVLSVFEEHTRWISKGKAGAPVELGVPVAIVEDHLLEHRILWEGSDTDAAVPVIVATRERFPELLACSFDHGFHSPQNQVALGDTLELNAMPPRAACPPAAAHTRRSRTSHWRASSIPPSSRQSTISSSAAWTGCAPGPSRGSRYRNGIHLTSFCHSLKDSQS